ncbi:MAG: aminodeoxychorismate synthase component I [Gammaproteobacteria bacterium]
MPPDNKQNSGSIISKTYQGCVDLLTLHTSNTKRYPFLLQSTAVDNKNSRFDILFAFPQQTLCLKSNSKLYLDNKICSRHDFLDHLDMLWRDNKSSLGNEDNTTDLPFTGGWFLYLAYEFLGQIENTVKTHKLEKNMNMAVAVRIPAVIICDHKNKSTHIIVENKFEQHFPDLVKDYTRIHSAPYSNSSNKVSFSPINNKNITEESAELFIARIKKAKKYIYDGDIFQSNLSREWLITDTKNLSAHNVYSELRKNNPAAFSGIACFNDFTIISSSPERLIKVNKGHIETRPIAGTMSRSENKIKDVELANKLLNHPKERSEHVMLVDMERNDLGRVCKSGSVKVTEMMILESLKHVHHIVSTIEGELHNNVSPGDIIKAVFPGGSITGCPKVRCMEIIHELEDKARNSYTGSMGYLDVNGNMDLNILIRTIEKINSNLSFKTGAGIVNDSNIDNELQETRNKAHGMLAAIS